MKPTDGFAWLQAPAGPMLVCRALQPAAVHFFTTRRWPPGSDPADTDARWEGIASAAGVEPACLVRVRQVHGSAVVVCRADPGLQPPALRAVVSGVGSGRAVRPEADIIVSNDPALALAVQTADCVPLLVADPATGAVAAAHAGWRGTAARVAVVTIDRLVEEFGSRRSDLLAAVGPAIGPCCYEVGDEVWQRFAAAGFTEAELARWFFREPRPPERHASLAGSRPQPGRWFLDLWSATRDQLEAAGITRDRIHVAELCTVGRKEDLCSYRRDGARAGRMAAVIRPSRPRPSPGSPGGRRER